MGYEERHDALGPVEELFDAFLLQTHDREAQVQASLHADSPEEAPVLHDGLADLHEEQLGRLFFRQRGEQEAPPRAQQASADCFYSSP